MDDVTRVGAYREAGRVRCDLRPGALSPRVLSTGPGTARVALVATRALLLGGDRVRVEVRAGEGVELELVEVSGTVAYAGRGRSASWDVDVRVDAGGLLVWDALPFVVADGADVERSTRVSLADGGARHERGVALLRETLVLGRSGEVGGRLRSRTRVDLSAPGAARTPRGVGGTGESAAPDGSGPAWRSDPARPEHVRELFAEDLDLDADRTLPGILGDARVVDSVLCLGARPPAPLRAAAADTSTRRSAAPGDPLRLDLDGPGALARHLGASTHDAGIDAVVAAWTTAARAARASPAPGGASPAPPADRGSTGTAVRAGPSGADHPDHRTTLLTTGA
ncbi:urease accessory protein UreD [Cellulosimicrobium cellulans]|uniref:urease accessory protein UreD n=1 Tax=Cellulosimicrobium cellulans TaxID=1710 RepID=UPI001965889B|nr:urease accessory protein UreD [Cellulosimicrobium cellulans]MBN0041888.1 urease accessory protein UreD [Cellulosimicrobium cellulans]